jgi:hypothetical protein
MVDLYRRKVLALVFQIATEDPELVLAFIEKLKASGEIEPDELHHVERIARKWISITQGNLKKARR